MFKSVLKFFFGTKSDRDLKRILPLVTRINDFELELQALSDEELRLRSFDLKTNVRQQIAPFLDEYQKIVKKASFHDIEVARKDFLKKVNSVLDSCLVEAFSLVREVSVRVLSMRHYDVQLMGGIILHQGRIAEMATGEGKTLAGTAPIYLNALSGLGVQVCTVNDYLAHRDCEWMRPVYEFLGVSVSVIVSGMDKEQRRQAYLSDIVYGTNNEFGFDYLRDNMVYRSEDRVQRELFYCVIDEIDSILIDEARTPLIISGQVDHSSHRFDQVEQSARKLMSLQSREIDLLLKELLEVFQNSEEAQQDSQSSKENRYELLFLLSSASPKHPLFLSYQAEYPFLKPEVEKAKTLWVSKEMAKKRQETLARLMFVYDEKSREIVLTDSGEDQITDQFPQGLSLEDLNEVLVEIDSDIDLTDKDKELKKRAIRLDYQDRASQVRSLELLLRAHILFQKDVDYVVQDNKVVIVDEFTGRMMPGRRFSDGLHEALESKERVEVQKESQTLATITLQNYFRMYGKLSGMTGTADTEADEFQEIYKLDVVVVPTHRPLCRQSHSDVVFFTEQDKLEEVVKEVQIAYQKGVPVLLGTSSIEKSEKIARLLVSVKVPHEVLNAKNHAKEADIIRLAGQKKAVTIATNMAGRGTDIVLGNGVSDLGGLYVIGSDRNESRRIDNQLRGRCARQGDPGRARFFLSLEDDLMRLFGSDKFSGLVSRFGQKKEKSINHPMISRAVRYAQKRVENQNFEIRKHLLQYDDVMNKQREIIYYYRNFLLTSSGSLEAFFENAKEAFCQSVCEKSLNVETGQVLVQTLIKNILTALGDTFEVSFLLDVSEDEELEISQTEAFQRLNSHLSSIISERCSMLASIDQGWDFVAHQALFIVDRHWKEHLYSMDCLRESVGLRSYAQTEPLWEYQREGSYIFSEMMSQLDKDMLKLFLSPFLPSLLDRSLDKDSVLVETNKSPSEDFSQDQKEMESEAKSQELERLVSSLSNRLDRPGSSSFQGKKKIGRNQPCVCGSGLKYKKCCGS